MRLRPMPLRLKLQLKEKCKSEKKRTLGEVKNPKQVEVMYRKDLLKITRVLRMQTNEQLIPALKQLESQYVNDSYVSDAFREILTDSYATTLQEVFRRMKDSLRSIDSLARGIAATFTGNANKQNRQRFYNAVEKSIGVSLESIINREDLDDILIATTEQNVSLIKTIPEEYFKKIETIVYTGTTQGSKSGSMIKQIMDIGYSTEKRAKLIARDQSSKLNSALNQKRQQSLGVEEYIWRTSGDDRVRDDHQSKNGKIFRWDNPPKDTGHPGSDIQCRCIAQPIIKL